MLENYIFKTQQICTHRYGFQTIFILTIMSTTVHVWNLTLHLVKKWTSLRYYWRCGAENWRASKIRQTLYYFVNIAWICKTTVLQWMSNLSADFYEEGVEKLLVRYGKHINISGIMKKNSFRQRLYINC